MAKLKGFIAFIEEYHDFIEIVINFLGLLVAMKALNKK